MSYLAESPISFHKVGHIPGSTSLCRNNIPIKKFLSLVWEKSWLELQHLSFQPTVKVGLELQYVCLTFMFLQN